MNCRVLPFRTPHPEAAPPFLPVDMAMRLCLGGGSPPLHSFLANACCPTSAGDPEPRRPCLSSGGGSSSSVDVSAAMALTQDLNGSSDAAWSPKKKKRVVFADARGLALAAVHVFDEAEEELLSELQFQLSEIEGATGALQLEEGTGPADSASDLVLDFTPPVADYLDLRNRLKAQQVSLETCSVQDHRLSGTVQVRNICFQKSVLVRVSFDLWKSYQDVQCRYLNNVYGPEDIDTFSFSVALPELPEPSSPVEFCIRYQTKDQTFWDNNHGTNYRLVVPVDRLAEKEEMSFDVYGSPRTSSGFFPEWQSWGHVDTTSPYW